MGVATRIRAAGWTVAVVDSRRFGGMCALWGCDPMKMLIGGTPVIDQVTRMHPNGVAGNVRIDGSRLMAFKRTFTKPNDVCLSHRGVRHRIHALNQGKVAAH